MSIIKLFKSRSKPSDRFEQLITPHINSLYRFAYRLCQCNDDSEELIQLLLTRLYLKLDTLEQVESLRPWLARSLYNLYVDGYRKQQRMASVFSAEEFSEDAISLDNTPYENIEMTQQQQIIVTAMQQLNENQRHLLMLHDGEGYTLVELSDILQTPIGTLKSRLHRARNLIREITEMELYDGRQRVKDREECK
jgi:RNA polymerase sigma-70 factor (ECF subfamily)